MSGIYEDYGNTKPQLVLDGKEVIVENIGVYDGSIPTTYTRKTILTFENEDKAAEYYYKKR